MTFEYARSYYGVPAKRGMRISVNGKMGTIKSGRRGYIMALMDGDKFATCHHPTWRTTYYDKDGTILKEYKD